MTEREFKERAVKVAVLATSGMPRSGEKTLIEIFVEGALWGRDQFVKDHLSKLDERHWDEPK